MTMFFNYDIDAWKREFDEITKHVKFGGADAATAFEQLKKKINAAVNGYFRKEEKCRLLFWLSLVVTIIMLLIVVNSDGLGSNAVQFGVIISIAACVLSHKAKKGCEDAVMAAYKFDEDYFGGEIFYRRKNG